MDNTPAHNGISIRRRLTLASILLGIFFAAFNTVADVAHASKGAGLMSQTMPTSDLSTPQTTKNEQLKPLALLGQKRVERRENDPLLRGNENAFADVLREREQATPDTNSKGQGLLYSLGLDDEAATLKRKAFSLMVQLGFAESGKTHVLRRAISNETRRAVVEPAAHAASQSPETKDTGTFYTELQEDGQENKDAIRLDTKNAATNEKAAPHAWPESLSWENTGNKDVAEPAEGSILAEGSHGLRMPVSTKLRRALAIDLVAEKKARTMLTQEAKAALLPVSGKLSAVFESGKDGIAAIGYDRRGGTSYGKYQIASRVGTMKLFLNFLNEKEPDWSERLRKAGPANTRSRWGGMPSEWKKIAAEDPERFELLQDQFILATNYQPALDGIKQSTSLDVAELSPAIQEVLWSTAVQHGPRGASTIFAKAARVAENKPSQEFDKALIQEVYRVRKNNFSSSSSRVRRAVRSRLNAEMDMALELLADNNA